MCACACVLAAAARMCACASARVRHARASKDSRRPWSRGFRSPEKTSHERAACDSSSSARAPQFVRGGHYAVPYHESDEPHDPAEGRHAIFLHRSLSHQSVGRRAEPAATIQLQPPCGAAGARGSDTTLTTALPHTPRDVSACVCDVRGSPRAGARPLRDARAALRPQGVRRVARELTPRREDDRHVRHHLPEIRAGRHRLLLR